MKTLILEPDPLRAQTWVAQFGGPDAVCHLARSPAQARLMLIGAVYDRLCLRLGELDGQSHAILGVARACNPECEIVDLVRQTQRPVSGPSILAVMREAARRRDQAIKIG